MESTTSLDLLKLKHLAQIYNIDVVISMPNDTICFAEGASFVTVSEIKVSDLERASGILNSSQRFHLKFERFRHPEYEHGPDLYMRTGHLTFKETYLAVVDFLIDGQLSHEPFLDRPWPDTQGAQQAPAPVYTKDFDIMNYLMFALPGANISREKRLNGMVAVSHNGRIFSIWFLPTGVEVSVSGNGELTLGVFETKKDAADAVIKALRG